MTGYHRAVRRAVGFDNTVATLETDVMRFMAILALCLVVIFALVQSLPLSSGNIETQSAEEPLGIEISDLQNQVETLRQEATELAGRQKRMRLAAAKELQGISRELTAAREEVTRKEGALASAEKRLIEKKGELARVEEFINEARQKESAARWKLDNAEGKNLSRRETGPAIPAKNRQASNRGFTLRFASEADLKSLLQRGRVQLYMMAPGKSWRLAGQSHRGWQFLPGRPPDLFYQMDADTVPDDFLQAAEEAAGMGGAGVEYGVVLPPAVKRQLKTEMKGRRGGELIIRKSGRVTVH